MTGNDRVRGQYEAYPYPHRKPADEAWRLVVGSPSHVLEINHYLFAGRRDLASGFRALFAGGGTGDGAIMLAQQLAWAGGDAEVVHLDLSDASQAIAKARAEARGLRNIRFVRGSLLDLPTLGLGSFDYIDCCGVLHHLESPEAGLEALVSALADGGGLGLMVYGQLGRSGVYDVQTMLRMIDGEDDGPARIARAKRLLADLPESNRLKRNPFIRDHLQGDDAGLYDLLLHSRDRAYTVPEVVALLESAGLAPTAWIEPGRYDPSSYLRNPDLKKRAVALPSADRAAFAELLAGNMKQHVVYAAPAGRVAAAVAVPDSPEAIPVLREQDATALARGLKPGGTLTATFDGLQLSYPLPRLGPAILSRVDGERDLAAIHKDLAAGNAKLGWETFKKDFDALYAGMNAINAMVIRYR
ncbi:MAG: methyltransferase [Rhodospirillaceae bacterium]|nr:methyltransferase [Rhodospirillaceae bacterium]